MTGMDETDRGTIPSHPAKGKEHNADLLPTDRLIKDKKTRIVKSIVFLSFHYLLLLFYVMDTAGCHPISLP